MKIVKKKRNIQPFDNLDTKKKYISKNSLFIHVKNRRNENLKEI